MKKYSLDNKKVEELASRFTSWVGSPSSIVAHTIFFVFCLILPLFGVNFDRVLLFLTTIVSLEAIYLGIFIQYTVNKSTERIKQVQEDVGEIQADVDEIQKDVDEIQEDVEDIEEDVGEIQEDVQEIQEDVGGIEEGVIEIKKDVDEIQKDVDEIQEDVDEIEEEDENDIKRNNETKEMISLIQSKLEILLSDIEKIKNITKK